MRDLYGRRRIKRDELMNPAGQMPVSPPPASMPNVNPFAGAEAPVAPIQRPVFERQLTQVARPDFSNILSMLQRRRRPMGM